MLRLHALRAMRKEGSAVSVRTAGQEEESQDAAFERVILEWSRLLSLSIERCILGEEVGDSGSRYH